VDEWLSFIASLPEATRQRIATATQEQAARDNMASMRRLVPEGGRTAMEPEYPLTGALSSILGSVKDAATLPGRALYGEVPRADEMPQGEAVGEALNMAGMVSLPALRGGRAANTVSMSGASDGPGIKAYHGSPHDFDRFSLDKIGTGEGAQAYGHGLYFAESEGVAKSYRDALSLDTPGSMYEVNIKANPDDFLDWDKPVSQQSEKVREFAKTKGGSSGAWEAGGEADVMYRRGPRGIEGQVRKAPRGFGPDWLAEYDTLDGRGSRRFATADEAKAWLDTEAPIEAGRGAEIYQGLRKNLKDPEITAELKKAGIPGIRYLDQGSRGVGEGSRNLVVFDDSMIEILRKYGLLGPLGLGAGAAAVGTNDGT
jgi:hypothetical protein